jgi:hypothetical protein
MELIILAQASIPIEQTKSLFNHPSFFSVKQSLGSVAVVKPPESSVEEESEILISLLAGFISHRVVLVKNQSNSLL